VTLSVRRLAGIVLAVCGVGVALCLAATAFFVITGRTNPLEALVLRVRLATASEALSQPAGSDGQLLCFAIAPGETAATVAARLRAQGIILDADLFTAYLRYYNLDSQLQAATYAVRRNLTIPEVAHILGKPGGGLITVRIIEGWRMEEIAAVIDASAGLSFTGAEFLALVGATGPRNANVQAFVTQNGIPAGRSLEGFLYPATYTVPACATGAEFVDQLLAAFDRNIPAQFQADARAQSLTMFQIVTLASIVEREAVVEAERPIIASVYWNRYRNAISASPNPNIPITLDADPTVQYALGNTRTPGVWWPRITVSDYRGVQSPYNTYLNRGLPPGPIASPRASSIQAALYPSQSNYLYFRASCAADGTHAFAATFAEQLANACS
jgi:UPF0755 protein